MNINRDDLTSLFKIPVAFLSHASDSYLMSADHAANLRADSVDELRSPARHSETFGPKVGVE